jgi:hypothetical protein
MRMLLFTTIVGLSVAACGSVASQKDAAVDDDAAVAIDAAAIDAALTVDARSLDAAVGSGTIREPMSAAGRLSGGGMVLDVELGHPISQGPITGGGDRFEGAAAIKP